MGRIAAKAETLVRHEGLQWLGNFVQAQLRLLGILPTRNCVLSCVNLIAKLFCDVFSIPSKTHIVSIEASKIESKNDAQTVIEDPPNVPTTKLIHRID